MPVDDAVSGPFSERLSPLPRFNMLINNVLKYAVTVTDVFQLLFFDKLCLFYFYLWNAAVLVSLEFEVGGGAAEAVAARGLAVVIEKVGAALEVDGAAMDGERAG